MTDQISRSDAISLLDANGQYRYQLRRFLLNIIIDSKVADTKFPGRQRIRSHRFTISGLDAWLVRDPQMSAQFAVADQLGYFKDEGLKINPRWYIAGTPKSPRSPR